MAFISGSTSADYAPDTLLAHASKNKGFSHKNRFSMDVFLPPIVKSNIDQRSLNLMCNSVTMPGRRIATRDPQFDGGNIKFPYALGLEEISAVFNLDGNYSIYDTFAKWMHKIINVDDYVLAYKKDITSTIEIYQLDKNNKSTYGMKLHGAFPIMLAPIDFSNTDTSAITTCSVSFSFDTYDFIK